MIIKTSDLQKQSVLSALLVAQKTDVRTVKTLVITFTLSFNRTPTFLHLKQIRAHLTQISCFNHESWHL